MKRKNSPAALAAFALLTLLVSGCGPKFSSPASTTVTDANLAAKIEQARTPADHEDIARYYDAQAGAAERGATEDREVKRSYGRPWPPGPSAGPAAEGHYDSATGTATLTLRGFGPDAQGHYDRLVESREDDAREYHALAEWHREVGARSDRSQASPGE